MKFIKSYPLTLSPDYLDHWGIPEAVREIVQNWLDQKERTKQLWWGTRESYKLRLQNKGVSLSPESLLLGSTTKSEGDRGGFGEGFKLALLILTRMGCKVTIHNGDVIWKPIYRKSEIFGTLMLHIDEYVNDAWDEDNEPCLEYVIEGINSEDKLVIERNTLVFQDSQDIGKYCETTRGTILMEQKGKIYVGGLYVCTKPTLTYGYNFNTDVMPLNRDRKSIDGWDMLDNAQAMIYETSTPEEVVDHLQAKMGELDSVQHSWASNNIPDSVADTAYKRHMSGDMLGCVLVTSKAEEIRVNKEGEYTACCIGNNQLTEVIKKSKLYSDSIVKKVVVPKRSVYNDLLDIWQDIADDYIMSERMEYDMREVLNRVKELEERDG